MDMLQTAEPQIGCWAKVRGGVVARPVVSATVAQLQVNGTSCPTVPPTMVSRGSEVRPFAEEREYSLSRGTADGSGLEAFQAR